MAKNTQTAALSVTLPEGFSFESFGHTLTAEHLSNPATLLYLVSNGFKQSLSDSTAMSKEAMEKAGLDTDEKIEAEKAKRRAARFASIIAGEMVAGSGGGRVKGIEAYIADLGPKMARAFLERQAKAKGKALPKVSSDEFKALVGNVLGHEAFSAKVRAEAEKRMEEDKALADSAAEFDIEI